jgi:hypothetical protein
MLSRLLTRRGVQAIEGLVADQELDYQYGKQGADLHRGPEVIRRDMKFT